MGRIQILPDTVADQIAAGEVVERPASVVKELVENALDAGATCVRVDLEGGGRRLIRVTDDGVGMDRDDAVLSVDRHATSKIASAGDLVGVATYGFRGEALPAIASVSTLSLETAPGNGEGADGTRIVVRGGRMEDVALTARQPGTTVVVERLFYNTPARRKFLRSQRSESRAASEALTMLALSRLDVAFALTSDGRTVLDVAHADSLSDRIAALFGRELAEQLVPVDTREGMVAIHGAIQRPADAKPAGRKAYLFVNGRPFRDPFLVRAAEAGYRGAIAPGSRPSLFLALDVPGSAVDVNVHPAKLEVRFRDKFRVERAVESAVRNALGPLAAAGEIGGAPEGTDEPWERRIASAWEGGAAPGVGSNGAVIPRTDGPPELFAPAAEVSAPAALQVFDTYLLMETPEGIAIIDQHSAHERVLYERTMSHLQGAGAAAQRLLLPLTVNLEPRELDAVDENRELLEAVGYEVEPFGGSAVAVHAVPNPHPRFDAQRCFQELVGDLARGRLGGVHNRLERFAATYACRAAVKAGDRLEPEEITALIRRLFACVLPPHDVHGRPSIVRLPRAELERRFGRG